MPEVSPGINHCGSRSPGWLRGEHPQEPGKTKSVTFCFEWSGNLCQRKKSGKVTNCGAYYVYFLKNVGCHYRYCAEYYKQG